MNKFTGMHVLECLDKLIDDKFFMDFLKNTSPNNNVEVSFHVIENQIKIFIILCFDDVEKSNNIFMAYVMGV